jgi:hypothetical protein
MNSLIGTLSPSKVAFVGALLLASLAFVCSKNAPLWTICFAIVPCCFWLVGSRRGSPVLLWILGINWLSIAADVFAADLQGLEVSEGWLGPSVLTEGWIDNSRVKAILLSLCGLIALSIGMRLGAQVGNPSRDRADGFLESRAKVSRLVACYLASLALAITATSFARTIPILTQPIFALALIKYVFIYLIADRVFGSNTGYGWLLLVGTIEILVGLTGFFSGYKEAIFVILIALLSTQRILSLKVWLVAIVSLVVVVWISLVWTVSKREYRYQHFSEPLQQRLDWMAHRFFVDEIDYNKAVLDLVTRVGYTQFFAIVLAKAEAGSLPTGWNFYYSAAEYVLKPRILFRDKVELNDTEITQNITGLSFNDRTSVSLGYMCQAYIDFGAPLFLMPIGIIGLLLGSLSRAFMRSAASWPVRNAFATAALYSAFLYGANVEKALGGVIISSLALFLIMKFGYPLIADWLEGPRPGRVQSLGFVK